MKDFLMKLGLGEILDNAGKLKSKNEKIEYLRKNDSRALQDILQYALHPGITWDLPEGRPPFTPTPHLDQENRLPQEMRRLYLFVNGNGNRLKPAKVETLFVQILESISPKDAELLLLAKERKLPKGITAALIDEVWPGLIPSDEDQKVSQE